MSVIMFVFQTFNLGNMKNLFLTIILSLSIPFIGLTQTSRSDVIYITDSTMNKDELYANGLSFFAIHFKSANNVIQMADPISGRVIGKGIVDDRDVTISIFCKDGRYKYDISIVSKINEMTLPINSLGPGVVAQLHLGVTKVPILFDGASYIPNKNRTYFTYDTGQWSEYRYYYDSGVGHNPLVMTKGMWNKWKGLVDTELSKQKYKELGNIPDVEFQRLITLLTSHMYKNDNSDW